MRGDRGPLRRVPMASAAISDPQLALVSAITNLEAGEVVEAQNDLRDDYESWPVHSTADLVILRRLVEQLGAASVGQAAALSDVGVDGGEVPVPGVGGPHASEPGAANLLERGDPHTARKELAVALSLARCHGFGYLEMQALTVLGLVAFGVGDLRAAWEVCSDATAAAARSPAGVMPARPPFSTVGSQLAHGWRRCRASDANETRRHVSHHDRCRLEAIERRLESDVPRMAERFSR